MKYPVKYIVVVLVIYAGALQAQELAFVNKTANEPLKSAAPEEKISVNFNDIDIIEALKFFSTKAGYNIIPTKKVKGRITLMVEDASPQDVFEVMLRSHNLAYDKKGDIYNVMSQEEYSDLYGTNFSDMRKVSIFQLTYAIPEQAAALCDALKSDLGKVLLNSDAGSILVIDIPEKLREIGLAIDSLERKNTVLEVFDLRYAQAKDIVAQLKNQLDTLNVGTIRADERTNKVIVQALPARMPDIASLIEKLDQKTKQVIVEVRIIRVRLNDSLSKGIQWEGLFQMATKYGLSYIGSYPFSAVMSATDPWRSRKTVLEGGLAPDGTDIIPVDYVGSYPFSGTVNNSNNFNASQPTVGLGNIHVGVVGHDDFDVVIRYLRTLGEVKVIATPKITVVNNQEARVHIGERQAYITNTTTQTTSTTTVAEEVTFIDVGVKLFITPTINDHGFVTLKLKPEVSNVSQFIVTTAGNQIPIINTSEAETTVIVKDATTILLGGLKEERDISQKDEVPFFSRIPLIGGLFRSSTSDKSRSELVLMVTPHIISGDELTTGYARDFNYKLDKEDQVYPPFTDQQTQAHKSYQEYTNPVKTVQAEGRSEELAPVAIKPMKEIP